MLFLCAVLCVLAVARAAFPLSRCTSGIPDIPAIQPVDGKYDHKLLGHQYDYVLYTSNPELLVCYNRRDDSQFVWNKDKKSFDKDHQQTYFYDYSYINRTSGEIHHDQLKHFIIHPSDNATYYKVNKEGSIDEKDFDAGRTIIADKMNKYFVDYGWFQIRDAPEGHCAMRWKIWGSRKHFGDEAYQDALEAIKEKGLPVDGNVRIPQVDL